jgi:hypothetical protein
MFFLEAQNDIPEAEFSIWDYKPKEGQSMWPAGVAKEPKAYMLIGPPGCGKSTFIKSEMAEYRIVTTPEEIGDSEEPVVILPEASYSKDYRFSFIEVSTYPIICLEMAYPKDLALYILKASNSGKRKGEVESYYDYLEQPQMDEGYTDILRIEFAPGGFSNSKKSDNFYIN